MHFGRRGGVRYIRKKAVLLWKTVKKEGTPSAIAPIKPVGRPLRVHVVSIIHSNRLTLFRAFENHFKHSCVAPVLEY